MNSEFLLKIADVLEEVAAEKTALHGELAAIKLSERKKIIEPLASRLSHLVGEDGVDKLSSLDDDVLSLISKAAGVDAPQLGGSTKLASARTGAASQADDAFGSWILS